MVNESLRGEEMHLGVILCGDSKPMSKPRSKGRRSGEERVEERGEVVGV